MKWLTMLGVLVLAAGAQARMYEWVNPDTGNVQLSGTPPAWYRSDASGPRVRVYDNGRLVDDTVIPLSPKHEAELRQTAFEESERRRHEEALKRLERAARRETIRQQEEQTGPTLAEAPSAETKRGDTPGDTVPETLDASMIDQLKDLIRAWDQQQTGEKAPPPATQ